MTAQLSVALDSPSLPALPRGKRVVRRKPTRQSAPAVEVDIANAPVQVSSGSTAHHLSFNNPWVMLRQVHRSQVPYRAQERRGSEASGLPRCNSYH